MEMLDVLNRLKEINESTPGLVDDAIDNVTRTNPKQTEAIVSEDSEDYSKMTDEKLIQTYNAVMANAYAGDAGAIEDEMEKRNLEENKKPIEEAKPDFLDMDKDGDKKEPMKKAIKDKEVVKEEDAYDNERFIIIGGKAKIDGGNTPDKKDHVYAPDAKTALQLHKQGKKVYKEELSAAQKKLPVGLQKAIKDKEEVKEGEVPAGLKKYLDKKSSDKKEDIAGDKQNQKQKSVGGEKSFKEVYKRSKKEAMNTTGDATVDNANQNLEPTEKPENDPDVKVAKKKTDVGSKTTGVDTTPEIAYKN